MYPRLQHHFRTAHGLVPCLYCPQEFQLEVDYANHVNIRHPCRKLFEYSFFCPVCNYNSGSSEDFKRHLLHVHCPCKFCIGSSTSEICFCKLCYSSSRKYKSVSDLQIHFAMLTSDDFKNVKFKCGRGNFIAVPMCSSVKVQLNVLQDARWYTYNYLKV